MAYARFYLSCHLRTTGSHIRPKNGYLTKEEVDLSTPPPPPPPDVAEDANVASTAATSSTIAPAPTKKTAHVRTRRLRNHIPALRHPLSSGASGRTKWTRCACLHRQQAGDTVHPNGKWHSLAD